MSSEVIGLKRGTVKLVPYNPKWTALFKEEKHQLIKTFGTTIFAIEHVGSTSIPGIQAKPIIDINIGVESLEAALEMKEKFQKLGYEHRPFVPGHTIEELKLQELYVKGSEDNRTHHVHVTVFESEYWKSNLLFRDFLCNNPDIAKEYSELKEKLAVKYPDNRKTYTEGKNKFIKNILSEYSLIKH